MLWVLSDVESPSARIVVGFGDNQDEPENANEIPVLVEGRKTRKTRGDTKVGAPSPKLAFRSALAQMANEAFTAYFAPLGTCRVNLPTKKDQNLALCFVCVSATTIFVLASTTTFSIPASPLPQLSIRRSIRHPLRRRSQRSLQTPSQGQITTHMAEPEESPDPESGSDLYRPDPSDSDDEDTLFIPEQLLTEVDAGLNIEETESQGEAEDQTRQSSTQTHGEKKPRKRKPQKKKPRTSEKDRTPLPSSSLSIEDPVPLPMDLDFPTLTSIYWGNPPTASEEYGTVEGENARLWMQAERDLVLDDAPEAPAPGHKRPIDLLDLSPAPLRKIYSAVYPQSKGKRLTWILAFCTTRAAVSQSFITLLRSITDCETNRCRNSELLVTTSLSSPKTVRSLTMYC